MPRSDSRFSVPQFGPNLRRERERAGLSKDELAAKVGFSRKHIAELESGKADPRLAVAAALAAALGVSVKDFGKRFLAVGDFR